MFIATQTLRISAVVPSSLQRGVLVAWNEVSIHFRHAADKCCPIVDEWWVMEVLVVLIACASTDVRMVQLLPLGWVSWKSNTATGVRGDTGGTTVVAW